jgi:acyl CoA:acetate/3-ketoacid CoA transferase
LAPGIDLDRDVLARLPFKRAIEGLREMSPIFRPRRLVCGECSIRASKTG